MTSPLSAAWAPSSLTPVLWSAMNGQPAIVDHRVRAPHARRDVFEAESWSLDVMGLPPSVPRRTLVWPRFPAPLREPFRRAAYLLLNTPTPQVMLTKPGTSMVEWPAPNSIRTIVMADWLHFATWLRDQGFTTLRQVGRDALEVYAKALDRKGGTWRSRHRVLRSVSRLWALSPALPHTDQLVMPPWEDEDIKGYISGEREGGDAATPVIHPNVMAPLLAWSLTFVTDLAEDIIAAVEHVERAKQAFPERESADSRSNARDHLASVVRGSGGILPGVLHNGGFCPANTYLAITHGGFHPSDLSRLLASDRAHVTLDLEQPQPLPTPVAGRIDGQLWRDHLDYRDLPKLRNSLVGACLVLIAYLSGMRPSEALSLTTGCCPPPTPQEDGALSYQLLGRHYKRVRVDGRADHEGTERTWVAIKPIAQAIGVLERLASNHYLFPSPRHPDRAMDARRAAVWIDDLITTANRLAEHLHLGDAYLIPTDPQGAVRLRRFRRTLAWHIRRLPGGRVALAIQYGHLSLREGESYAGLKDIGLLTMLDAEEGTAVVEGLHDLQTALRDGEGISGPAADRLLAAADKAARYDGVFLTAREFKKITADSDLQVFDNPDAYLFCVHDPDRAKCTSRRANARKTGPNLNNCHQDCANAARTDTQMTGLAHKIEQMRAEAGSPLTPEPLRLRLASKADDYAAIIQRHTTKRRTYSEEIS